MKRNDLIEKLLNRPIFSPAGKGDASDAAWSVRNNLKVLLNTRQGTLPHLPDYGLPDISVIYTEFPDSIEMLRREIKKAVCLYEPRLDNVNVKLIERKDDVFRASYFVSAELTVGSEKKSIGFQTQINSDGLMEVL